MEDLLCSFVTVLAHQSLKHRTAKVYLSALCFMQIQAGLKDTFAHVAWPRLDYAVKGIKKVEAEKGVTTCTWRPITPLILQKLGPCHHHTVHLTERCSEQPAAWAFLASGGQAR